MGARGDKFGAVTFNNSCVHEETMFASFKFKHRSGHVRCVDEPSANSKWGCTTKTFDGCLAMLITDEENNVLFPKKRLTQFRDVYNLDLYYEIPTFDQNSDVFVLSDFTSPLSVEQGKTLRVWYSEDLTENPSSKDNHGTVCFDLYALVVLPPHHIYR